MPVSTATLSQIQETAARLRKAVEKENNYVEFDTKLPLHTNRGNKLKRKAELYRDGQLGGQRPFKKKIDHAGYERHILYSNPKRYDADGYELDADDEDQEADEAFAEKNPYNQVIIQDLLMPLTAASELEHHPTLSLPYKSKVLPEMVRQACSMLHKERKTLVELKGSLTRFRGDHPWIPCGRIFSKNDVDLFVTDIMPEHVDRILVQKPNEAAKTSLNGETILKQEGDALGSSQLAEKVDKVRDEDLKDAESNIGQDSESRSLEKPQAAFSTAAPSDPNPKGVDIPDKDSPSNLIEASNDNSVSVSEAVDAGPAPQRDSSTAVTDQGDAPIADASPRPRMLTRHQAQAQASQSQQPADAGLFSPTTSSTGATLPIHPLYLVPPSALPDKNFGLPDPEAEETRRVLSALVQKQEEVVRGAEQLYEGLLKAHRLSRTLWSWCRAEGHVDEMSDGEDWVDLEEWGLETMLKKGMEEGGGETEGGGGVGAKESAGTGKGTEGSGAGAAGGVERRRGRKGIQS